MNLFLLFQGIYRNNMLLHYKLYRLKQYIIYTKVKIKRCKSKQCLVFYYNIVIRRLLFNNYCLHSVYI